MNLLGFPRVTADLDLTVDLGGLDPESFVRKLVKAGFAPRFSDPEFIAATRVIPVVQTSTGLPIDLVLAGPGLEQRFLDEVELARIADRSIPILSPENLVVTKLLAARPKDLQDIRELIAIRDQTIDHDRIVALLRELEHALDRSDLVPLYATLRKA